MSPHQAWVSCPCCGEAFDPFTSAHWRTAVAMRDPLTAAPNYALLEELSDHILSLARRYGRFAAVLRVELAGLGEALDRLAVEDDRNRLLTATHERLHQGVRDSDVVARVSRDGFAVLLSDLWEPESSARVAHRMLAAFEKALRVGEHRFQLAARIGAAIYPQNGEAIGLLLERAEAALGRLTSVEGGLEYFDQALGPESLRQIQLEQDLRHGLAGEQFELNYQPIVAAASGRIVGIEALARWNHLTRGQLAAEKFIGLAEKSGRILSIDKWAIDGATAQARRWLDGGWRGWVSVNVSARSLVDRRLVGHVANAIARYSLGPGSLVVEVTETAALRSPAETSRALAALSDLGVYVALDDFGTGYSSFRYMQAAHIDILKLDRSFLSGLGQDARQARLLEGLILMSHHLGKPVVAEGVEEERHHEWLESAGCDLLQGYLTGRPVSAAAFAPTYLGDGPVQADGPPLA